MIRPDMTEAEAGRALIGSVVLVAFVVAWEVLVCGCGTVPPTPDPVPVPAPSGTFAGFHDCTAQDNSAGTAWANTCGDVENTGQCFEDLAAQGASRALLICAARDVEVAGYIEMARGTAGPELTARAQRLRAWIAGTGATPRSTP